MVLNMKIILEEMGWSDGYHIPIANDENVKLEAEVERLTLAKAKATVVYDALSSKCSALEKHMKNVTAEQEQNQDLLMARHSQLSAEKTLHTLAKVDKERLSYELKQVGKDLEQVESRKQTMCTDLNKLVTRMDKLKMSVEWDEQTIENWEEVLLKKHEDNDIIKKFSKEDEKKAKELELKRQRLQEEEHSRRQLIIRNSTEMDSMELTLLRNVQLYKQLHEERNNLVRQWQEAVKHLQKRDKETLALNREIITTQEVITAREETLEQEKQFYENEMNNNKDMEREIEEGNQELARLRKDLSNCVHMLDTYTVELDGMKRELKKTASLLQTERIKVKNFDKDRIQRQKELEEAMLKVKDLQIQYKNVQESNLTAAERTRALDDLLRTEEAITRGLHHDVENMQGILFRSQQALNALVEESKLQVMEAKGKEQGLNLLQRQTQKVEAEFLVHKENMYKLDFRMNMIETKMARLLGESKDDLSEVHAARLKELNKIWDEVSDTSNLLQSQIDRLEEDMRKLTNGLSIDNEKLFRLKDKMQEYLLLVDGALKQVQQCKNEVHKHQVEENVLKVKVKHGNKALHQEGSTIFNLKRQQLELESAMKERETEIEVNKEILMAKRSSLNEDKNHLTCDIQGRRIKIDHLKKRHDCVVASMGKTDDGEMVSVAYFKVKNAQEKYMLQEEGDRLDSQIRKAEREIIAMENTLKVVNLTNETYKKNLTLVDDQDDELVEMQEIETELYNHAKATRQNRNRLLTQQEKLQTIQQSVDEKEEKIIELQNKVTEVEKEYGQMQGDAEHRREKIERADKQIKKLKHGKVITEDQEKDFLTRQLQNTNQSALQQLSETCVRHLETEPNINRYLSERDINLKTIFVRGCASSRYRSTPSYTSSSRSSVSSSSSIS